MLNIGKLGPGAAEYYIGEVASAAEDYYTGQGEVKGRWVGSLRQVLALDGEVDPEHFRRVLNGENPHTGERLISAQGSAARASGRASAGQGELPMGDAVDSARAAAFLGVSHQYVRRLLKAGAAYSDALDDASPDDIVQEPRSYLLGERVEAGGRTGVDSWQVPATELERLASQRTPAKPRPGYDVTLRPPKSVSVLWALSSADVRAEIRLAHAEAVDEVVRYMESDAVRARVSDEGRRHLVETDGVIAAAFDHRTSRAGDPLLHTHVVVANMTRVDGADGPVWRAIAGYGLFEHAKAAGHLYQAHLRHLLSRRLGVEWRPAMNGYADIAGVSEAVIETFSKRRTEIAEVLAESGNTSARAAQIATLETRKPKRYGVDSDALFEQWRREAEEAGLAGADVERLLGRSGPASFAIDRIEDMFAEMAGPTGLTERKALFHRSHVIESLSTRLGDAATARGVEELADRFISSLDCVVVDSSAPVAGGSAPASAPRRRSPTQVTYTTKGLAEIELQVLKWAADRDAASASALPSSCTVAALSDRPELSPEQAAMVQTVCTHADPVMPVAGRPGAGKTYATEAIVAAHVEAGVPILGCAVSATAAAELEQAAGFRRSVHEASTVAKLLMDLDRWGGLAPGSVVVVDEASMVATRDLHRLVGHARAAGGSVVLIGDPDQHGPVEVGGVFQRLCRDRGDGLVCLVENNRQRDHVERLAIAEYRDEHVSDALSRLDNAGRVVRSATAGESFDAMVADWYADHLDGGADPMIAGPNSTRRALNDRARTLLRARGELTGDPMEVGGREYLVGDVVVARRNDRRLRVSRDGEFVKNGSAGVVTKLHHDDSEVTVDFEREGTIRVPRTYLAAGRLEHGYARTSYGVQGATHTTARYHPTDQSGYEEGYVAITRGRDASRLYIVDGTIAHGDDEAHQRPESQRFDLDDIADALGRRRTGTMAADAADALPSVHHLATTLTLAELRNERARLEAILADAPPDAARVVEGATGELEALHMRRNLWRADDPMSSRLGALDRAIASAGRRLGAAQRQQDQRTGWLDDHADVVDRYALVCRAEQHRTARLAANPVAHLPAEAAALLGPEPVGQPARRVWHQRMVSTASSLDGARSDVNAEMI